MMVRLLKKHGFRVVSLCALFGGLIMACGPQQVEPPVKPPPKSGLTWYKDVQPLIQQHCQVCHEKDGVAPLPLTTYDEVKASSAVVKWAIESRRMPPWMPNDSDECWPLAGSRRLSQKQIDTIVDWIRSDMAKGDAKDSRPYRPKKEQLAWVDSEVDMQASFVPNADKPDSFHCFLTKSALDANRELSGWQFIPGVKAMVHHVLIYSVTPELASTLQTQNKGHSWSCSSGALFGGGYYGKAQLLGVWVPGTDAVHFPKDTGIPMVANSHIVLEIHYNLGSLKAPVPDRSKIRLQFAKSPVKYKLSLVPHAQVALWIPPKTTGHEVSHQLTVPAKVRVWGLMPHMHGRGRKFKVTLPRYKGRRCMVDIDRWDYNWQQTYFFQQPLGYLLSIGALVKMTCTYDNETDQGIRWGERTNDEMCLNFYYVSAP